MQGSMLVLGGTRSGKSAYAEALAELHEGPVTYVATGAANDTEMADRIATHQARRPTLWDTAEVGADLAPALHHIHGLALVDSLGTWVAAHPDLVVDLPELVAAIQQRPAPIILVSDEVGMGVHPATEVGRHFRDVLGEVNRAVSLAVDDAVLVVAGRSLRLNRP